MTNKIIEAARLAGGTTYTNRHFPGETACAFSPWALREFYAIARNEALEDAAKLCETTCSNVAEKMYGDECAEAIRALKEQQHG